MRCVSRNWLLRYQVVIAIGFALPLIAHCVRAGDWPQILGPERNGKAQHESLADAWPDGGPKLAWDIDLPGGDSQSSVVVAGGRLYTMASVRGKGGSLVCVDAATRKVLWTANTADKGSGNATPAARK